MPSVEERVDSLESLLGQFIVHHDVALRRLEAQVEKELIVIFGSITFPENVIRQASKNMIYVLAWREWEYMDILNFEEVSK